MAYRVAVCDDDREQIQYISSIVSEWERMTGCACEVRSFCRAEDFLFEYEEDRTYDILLLDVEMEKISGIELAKHIRRDGSRAEIIFITSHFEFIGEGYEVDALHYLVKPIAGEKLMQVLSKAAERLAAEPPSLVITCEGETVRLYEREILYVESFLHYVEIHTKEGQYRIKESISSFENRLSGGFYRVHRSYLVSLQYITKITRTSVTLEGKTQLPLARGKYDDINRAFIRNY
ncbi:MAG: response regulator transcription factor [Lachnospiraceae bacterium]|nr:response regulator transcription factor [Lachnospiraceae bacterium]